MNCSYYAALSGIRALLILDGVNPESHGGAVTTLGLRFIRTKLLPVSVTKFQDADGEAHDVDYGDFESISPAEAEDCVQRAEVLLRKIDTFGAPPCRETVENMT